MGKFSGLAASVSDTFKVILIDPISDQAIVDIDGAQSFVEVLSADSDEGRKFDKEQRAVFQRRAMRGRNQTIIEDDQLEQNVAKLARLTRSWHLVDPESRAVIDVPCTPENAHELYTDPGTAHIFRQVWLGANETANFIKRSSKS